MYEKVVNFFKYINLYDKNVFEKIKNNTKIIDKKYDEIKDFVGCYPIYENNKIVNYKLILPKLIDVYSILIYIHEYSHVLFKTNEEIIPNIMEAIYINNFVADSKIKQDLINKTIEEINSSDSNEHIIGKKVKICIIKI